jgi:hypothetical protein
VPQEVLVDSVPFAVRRGAFLHDPDPLRLHHRHAGFPLHAGDLDTALDPVPDHVKQAFVDQVELVSQVLQPICHGRSFSSRQRHWSAAKKSVTITA